MAKFKSFNANPPKKDGGYIIKATGCNLLFFVTKNGNNYYYDNDMKANKKYVENNFLAYVYLDIPKDYKYNRKFWSKFLEE